MNDGRPHRTSSAASGWRRFAISLLGLALVTTPVSYRAGADVAHAHSFIHFLSDAASGSMDHHRRSSARPGTGHRQPHAETPRRFSAAPLGSPVIEPFRGAIERTTAIGLVLLAALFFVGGGTPLSNERARQLFGFDACPPVPPPRPAAIGSQ